VNQGKALRQLYGNRILIFFTISLMLYFLSSDDIKQF